MAPTSTTTPAAAGRPTPGRRRVPHEAIALAPRQSSLLDAIAQRPSFDEAVASMRRHELTRGAWVDVVPAFVRGAAHLFDDVAAAAVWHAQQMMMYEEVVDCPRLTAAWTVADLPEDLAVLRAMAAAISQRYRVALTQVSANLYRDGSDSVAWHGDRGARDVERATIAVLSLGASRPFRLRERDGAGRLSLRPASGDLLVMGGTCQRTWQHTVPKVADAGPRISVMFRPASYTT